MPIELRIESGARAGHVESFDKTVISVGRHPMMDLRFDPKQDLDVSTRHGEIRFVDGKFSILDTQSTNGTFVNGHRVARGTPQALSDGDVIAFGANGPRVRVRLSGKLATPAHGLPRAREHDTPPATLSASKDTLEPLPPAVVPPTPPAAKASTPLPPPPVTAAPAAAVSAPPVAPRASTPLAPPPSAPAAAAAAPIARPKRNTGERVAVAVAEQTRNVKLIAAGAVIVLGGLAAGLYIKSNKATAQVETLIAEIRQQQQDFESKLGANSQVVALSRQRSDSLERRLREAKGADAAALAQQVRDDRELRQAVVNMDPKAIAANNKAAIALITSQIGDAKPAEATGFIVSTSGLLVTNRHVVMDESGTRASGIFVKLTGNSGTRSARVVRVLNDSADLALLQIQGAGPFPTVRGIAPRVDAEDGSAIVTLGFPMGTDLPQNGSTVEPTLTMGAVARSIKDLLQIDSWATQGASGSPVFDTHGHVIGVIYGGEKNTNGRVVYAVPADRINELIKNAR